MQFVHNGPNDAPVIIIHNVKKEILLKIGIKDNKDNDNDKYESKRDRITMEDGNILVIKHGPMNILDNEREITNQIPILCMVCFVACSSDSSLNITKYIGS
jgi:hypothetical protein